VKIDSEGFFICQKTIKTEGGNMKLYRKTRIPGWYEYYRTPCPICGHTGGCMVYEKGDRVACIRVESERFFSKNSALPSYLHFLKPREKEFVEARDVEEFPEIQKKDASTLDLIYRALLDHLELTDKHYRHLTSPQRNLTDIQIMIREYKSFPERPWAVVRLIEEELGISDFTGIPGFYLKDNQYWTLSGKDGILIPYRNQYNQIVGFQYRIDNPLNEIEVKIFRTGMQARIKEQPDLVQVTYDGEIVFEERVPVGKEWKTVYYDKHTLGWIRVVKGTRYFWLSSSNKPKGTGSGNPAPVHVAVSTSFLKNWETGTLHKTKTVWLTEGALKADIAADKILEYRHNDIGTTFLALPGVGAWRLALPILEEMGVEKVNLAFDADIVTNARVKKHLFECIISLKERYHVNLAIWSESDGKGIDDLLNNKILPHIKEI
jgi:hypothetical protein